MASTLKLVGQPDFEERQLLTLIKKLNTIAATTIFPKIFITYFVLFHRIYSMNVFYNFILLIIACRMNLSYADKFDANEIGIIKQLIFKLLPQC